MRRRNSISIKRKRKPDVKEVERLDVDGDVNY
jgi:hypothetical protein